MPNHLDGSLEFFNADGSSAGTLQRRDDSRIGWQAAPGTPTTAGQSPARDAGNAHSAAAGRRSGRLGRRRRGPGARAGAGRRCCARSTPRAGPSIPFAHAGDEHLSLLLGHPVCVRPRRAPAGRRRPGRRRRTTPSPRCRCGWATSRSGRTGCFGYFVNDDYSVLHVADAAAAGLARPVGPQSGLPAADQPVPGFYDSFADDISARRDGTDDGRHAGHPSVRRHHGPALDPARARPISLTLLVEPMTVVHATPGLVPRKEIGMRRAWVQAGLAAIAPTFQFGPVLVDPQHHPHAAGHRSARHLGVGLRGPTRRSGRRRR